MPLSNCCIHRTGSCLSGRLLASGRRFLPDSPPSAAEAIATERTSRYAAAVGPGLFRQPLIEPGPQRCTGGRHGGPLRLRRNRRPTPTSTSTRPATSFRMPWKRTAYAGRRYANPKTRRHWQGRCDACYSNIRPAPIFVLTARERCRRIRESISESRSDFAPYDGYEITGWALTVIDRGDMIIAFGHAFSKPGRGQFLCLSRLQPPDPPVN
jgi:hypothetical protein